MCTTETPQRIPVLVSLRVLCGECFGEGTLTTLTLSWNPVELNL